MAEIADVIIIGGGIVGSSIAYNLAVQGCTNVLIIEREEQQGLGSTSKSLGGVRVQFATPVNIQMSLYSIDFFSRFEEMTGSTAGYKPHGYVFCATKDSHLTYLKENQIKQKAMGVTNVKMISTADIAAFIPQMVTDDIIGGSYCPTDGFVDPNSIMTGFAKCAKELGVRVWTKTEVTGINLENRKITGVNTSNGEVHAPVVVNAAGPWAARIAAFAGVDLPVKPLRRQIVKTQSFDALPAKFPMMIDMSNGFHFRREGDAILLAWPDDEETYGFQSAFTPEFIEKVLVRAVERVPILEDASVNPKQCWAGMYEVSPDHHAIIGEAPTVKGLFFANGFSGHGVMHSPASGRATADLILHGKCQAFDVSSLGVERFEKGELLEETAVI